MECALWPRVISSAERIIAGAMIRTFDWTSAVAAREDLAMPNSPPIAPQHIQLLVLERIDATANMARYYVLSVEPALFGGSALVRQWGRLGSAGQQRINLHAKESDARVDLNVWLARKLRRGYVIRACEEA